MIEKDFILFENRVIACRIILWNPQNICGIEVGNIKLL